MKQKIIEYFTVHKEEKSLTFIKEIEETGSFLGLNEIIWDLEPKVKDLIEQLSLMEAGNDPLSLNLSSEIEDMRNYLISSMVKDNISSLLLVYYFSDCANLSQSPIDCKGFNLEKIVINCFKL